MGTSDEIVVSAAGVFFGGVVLIVFPLWRRARLNQARYRLHAVRDELCFLVINGQLRETSRVYRVTTQQINTVLREQQNFSIRALSKRVLEADTRALSQAKAKRLYFEELKSSPPDVQAAVAHFYMALLHVIVTNSTVLPALLFLRQRVGRIGRRLRSEVLGRSLPTFAAYQTSADRLRQVEALPSHIGQEPQAIPA
jgi:hypothetical protein